VYVLYIVVCPFVLFLLAIVLSVLRYTDSDYPFGIFKLFLQEFLSDYRRSISKINDFDRRLATILLQAFDDCSTTESVFKVSHIIQFMKWNKSRILYFYFLFFKHLTQFYKIHG